MDTTPKIIWRPQPGPQSALLKCPVFEVLYGGARGGGKTDGMLGGDWPLHAQRYGINAKGIFFRKTQPQLDDAISRSKEIYYQLGASWGEQKKTWVFPNGATFKFRTLEREGDAEKYQGHSYTRVYVEELTNYANEAPIAKLKATLRSATGVPVGFRATANPGGPGHLWVKARYIDPAPDGWKIITDDEGQERVFIPAKLRDNQILVNQDPGYERRLKQSGSEQLVRAWLEGDWDIIEGAYFDNWRHELHVIKPFTPPPYWKKIRSMDWGSARPFSVGWWYIASEDIAVEEGLIPEGSLIRYREWYGAQDGAINVGLKLTAEEVAEGIAWREGHGQKGVVPDDIAYGVLDPSAFANDGGPSIQERMYKHAKILWRKADNKRVPGNGRMGGWDQMRARLNGVEGRPLIYCFTTCKDSIRTIPALQHDELHPEDVDTNSEDHAGDEWRYACMSRPIAMPVPGEEYGMTDLTDITMDDMWKELERQNRRIGGEERI